jgi:2-polyprenyl-6-methoxyphenol hydroxylase-like FAD-dependent oxidoreductase
MMSAERGRTSDGPVTVDVVITGGGPTGLMLASELRLGGADPVVLERLADISEIPKGNGLVGQIVPMLDYRGLLERFAADATWAGPIPRFRFGPLQLDLSRLGVSPLHILAIPQRRLERLLEEHLRELGGSIRRGHELVALSQDDDGVTLNVRGPDGDYQLRTGYLVGCDGAHSLVRKQAGIDFPGVTSSELSRIGRVFLPGVMIVPATGEVDVPGIGRLKSTEVVRTPRGECSLAPLAMLDKEAQPGVYIVYTREDDPSADLDVPMTLDELRASVRRVLGADLPMSEPQWLTRTVGNSRQADRYLAGRVLLAGDAAHVLGVGGSLNVGLLDAVNLGWKLAAELRGWAPGGLLDSYQTERHAVGKRAILQTRAQRALFAGGEGAEALRELFGELLEYPEPLRHIAEMMQGSDVRFQMTAGGMQRHPLLGRCAPDLRLETGDGTTRVAELMRAARGVLIDFTAGSAVAEVAADWHDRVDVVAARSLTRSAPVAGLLIRPDGYVAWAAGPDVPDLADGLHEALSAWFGRPAA